MSPTLSEFIHSVCSILVNELCVPLLWKSCITYETIGNIGILSFKMLKLLFFFQIELIQFGPWCLFRVSPCCFPVHF